MPAVANSNLALTARLQRPLMSTNLQKTSTSIVLPIIGPFSRHTTRKQFVGKLHTLQSFAIRLEAEFLLSSGNSLFGGARQSMKGFSNLEETSQPHHTRGLTIAAKRSGTATDEAQAPILRSLVGALAKPYFNKNPTAASALDLIRKQDGGPICYDHFAFRTFGVDGCGISAMSQIFLDLGYTTRDELRFPAKKLRALWFSPPTHLLDTEGELEFGPMPRIFISEILVDQLSPQSQKVIQKYTKGASFLSKHSATASVLNTLTWPTPSLADYQQLASESEYAAWTLVNGYALNHATISVHRLWSLSGINKLNQFLQEQGIKLNSDGGILKVSPDGGLQQSSSVADSVFYQFADGEVQSVPASYIEFAERLVLAAYCDLKPEQTKEWHRREGFEAGNADKIFESTSSDQTGLQKV